MTRRPSLKVRIGAVTGRRAPRGVHFAVSVPSRLRVIAAPAGIGRGIVFRKIEPINTPLCRSAAGSGSFAACGGRTHAASMRVKHALGMVATGATLPGVHDYQSAAPATTYLSAFA